MFNLNYNSPALYNYKNADSNQISTMIAVCILFYKPAIESSLITTEGLAVLE